MKINLSRKIFLVSNTVILALLCILMMLPFLKILSESLSLGKYVESGKVFFWPKGWNIETYKYILGQKTIKTAFYNSIFITVIGTVFNLLMTAMFAYPLSREEFRYKKPILFMVTITMIVSAPLIPNYLLIRSLGLLNTRWAVIIPTAISAYNFHVQRSFFKSIPNELIENARIDGASEMKTLFGIVLPLSKASLAAIGLFYAVAHWNAFMKPLIFLQKTHLHTLQIKIYQLISYDIDVQVDEYAEVIISQENVKMATIVVATIPILCVYPFLQKHFTKGVMLGSVKG